MEINLKINFPSNINQKETNQMPKTLKITYCIDFNNNDNINDNNNLNSKNIILNLQNKDNNIEIKQEKDKNDNLKNNAPNIIEINNSINNQNNNPINLSHNNENNKEKNETNYPINNANKNEKINYKNDINEFGEPNEIKPKNENTPKINNISNSRDQSQAKRSYDKRSNNNVRFRGRGGTYRGKYREMRENRENKDIRENNNFNTMENDNIMIPNDAKEELFVTGIREWMSENDIKEIFSKYGEVEWVKNLKDKVTGINKGAGFVKFKEKKSAFFAMMDAQNIVGKGKNLKIRYNMKNKEHKININKDNGIKKDENEKDKEISSIYSFDKKSEKSKESFKKINEGDNVSHYSSYKERSRDKDINKQNDDW